MKTAECPVCGETYCAHGKVVDNLCHDCLRPPIVYRLPMMLGRVDSHGREEFDVCPACCREYAEKGEK